MSKILSVRGSKSMSLILFKISSGYIYLISTFFSNDVITGFLSLFNRVSFVYYHNFLMINSNE